MNFYYIFLISDPGLLQTEYRPNSSRDYGGDGVMVTQGEEECFQSLQRKSILKTKKTNCDTSPDIIPHHDNGKNY